MPQISLTGLFSDAEGKGVELKKAGSSYLAPHKMSEFYDMEHNPVVEDPEGFCIKAERYSNTSKIEITIHSDLLDSEDHDWAYTIVDSSCGIELPEERIKWENGSLLTTVVTQDLGADDYTINCSIFKYTGVEDFSDLVKTSSTKTPVTIP